MNAPNLDDDDGSDLVRALGRGLTIISALNQFNGLTVRELAGRVALSEPTTIRLLKTLAESGYVVRSAADRRFRLSLNVRDLNCGYRAPSWIERHGRPVAEALQAALIWPVSVVALIDGRLWQCVTTDRFCPLLTRRSIGAADFPILTTAAGWVFLAFLPAEARLALLAQARRAEPAAAANASDDAVVEARLARIVGDGHALYRHDDHSVVAAPILRGGALIGVLGVRHERADALSRREIVAYADALRSGAAEIAAGLAAT